MISEISERIKEIVASLSQKVFYLSFSETRIEKILVALGASEKSLVSFEASIKDFIIEASSKKLEYSKLVGVLVMNNTMKLGNTKLDFSNEIDTRAKLADYVSTSKTQASDKVRAIFESEKISLDSIDPQGGSLKLVPSKFLNARIQTILND